nr:MAG TPA: Terminase small subunit [Caudoviricetes sp.]
MWEFFIYKTGGEVALKLNARQKAFCEYYVASGNATEAAIKAGYSERTAKSIGQRLLTFVDIKKYIDELMQKLESERIATAEEVLQNLTAMMRGEIQEEVIVVEGEGEGVSSARIIKKQVSAKDRIKAAELLGKRHALFTDKTKIEGTLPVMIVGEDDLDE